MAGLKGFAQLYLQALSAGTVALAGYWAYRYLAGGYNPLQFASSIYFWISTLGGVLTVAAALLLFRAAGAKQRVALTLMAFLFFVVLVDFLILFAWHFVGGIGNLFGTGLLHTGLRATLLPYAVPAFAFGTALALLLYATGVLSQQSQNSVLRRIEPSWPPSFPEFLYWSLLFVWCVLCVGPLGEILHYRVGAIFEALSGQRTHVSISAGLVLPVAFAVALAMRSGASMFILVIYILNSALSDFLALNILPDSLHWRFLIRAPLVLGLSLVSVFYLIRTGTLRAL